MSVVCRRHCCRELITISCFYPESQWGPISTKLDTEYLWVKGIQVFVQMKGYSSFKGRCLRKSQKIGWGCLWIFIKNHWARKYETYLKASWYHEDSSLSNPWPTEVGCGYNRGLKFYMGIFRNLLISYVNMQASSCNLHSISFKSWLLGLRWDHNRVTNLGIHGGKIDIFFSRETGSRLVISICSHPQVVQIQFCSICGPWG